MRGRLGLAAEFGKIVGSLAWERTFVQKVVHGNDVPRDIPSITPEWLTAVLCTDHPAAAVIAFRTDSDSSGTSVRPLFFVASSVDVRSSLRVGALPLSASDSD
jgi:hypothetical protein